MSSDTGAGAGSWPQHLILIGPMGAGKSSVGRTAAAILRIPFVDTDHMVENGVGKSVAALFEEHGEEEFRRVETLALQRLLVLPSSVVATGGGAVLRDENWEYMQASGLVVRLLVSPEESMRRIRGDSQRPLLAGGDPLLRLKELHQRREPFYARAPVTVHAEGRSVQDVARETVEVYLQWLSER